MLRVNLNSVSVLAKDERRVILKEIKFDVEAGQVYTILGKNGSGKTTLIKSLTALLPDDQYEVSGSVFLNGTNLLSTTNEDLRAIRKKNIRYVLQDIANSLDPLKKLKYYFSLAEVETENIEKQLKYFLLPPYNKLCRLHSYD
ncbi:MAG: ATP-binding cassette domain-containing protein [Ignavibacteriaceae bacterium]